MSEMVKLEVEIPGNIYKTLQAIGEACHLTVEEILQWGALGETECFTNSPWAFTDHFVKPLIKRVEELEDALGLELAVRGQQLHLQALAEHPCQQLLD